MNPGIDAARTCWYCAKQVTAASLPFRAVSKTGTVIVQIPRCVGCRAAHRLASGIDTTLALAVSVGLFLAVLLCLDLQIPDRAGRLLGVMLVLPGLCLGWAISRAVLVLRETRPESHGAAHPDVIRARAGERPP